MDNKIRDIISENIDDYKLCYEANSELELLKNDLFNNNITYNNIDKYELYNKLGEIFEYSENYNMEDTIIRWVKEDDMNSLFNLYALAKFDEFVLDILKNKYSYDIEFIKARYNEIVDLDFNEIIDFYKANTIKDELEIWWDDWLESNYKQTINKNSINELSWGLVKYKYIIEHIDNIDY